MIPRMTAGTPSHRARLRRPFGRLRGVRRHPFTGPRGGRLEAGARVVLTGASSGIGAELARVFAARGARLAITARRRERLEALADELGEPRALVFETDLSERGAAAELGREAEAALGGVDVLVNNAGGGVGGRIATVADRDEAREAFEVNYWSPLALVRALLPAMLERDAGMVVNVTSMAQVNTWPGSARTPRRRAPSAWRRRRSGSS